MFKKINEAYTTLGDEQKKRNYDLMGSTNSFVGKKNVPVDIGDFLSHMFQSQFNINTEDMGFGDNMPNINIYRNGENIYKSVKKPQVIEKHIEILLQDAYKGMKYPIEIERWIISNNIKTNEKETIYVDIPPGIDTGEIIVLNNKGNVYDDKNKGDVKVYVKVTNSSIFTRRGLNIILNKKITLKEALVGFKLEFKHFNGKTYCIKNDEGDIIKPDYTKDIQGLGMVRNNSVGSLIIKFNIEFPDKVDLDKVKILKEIL